MTPLSAAGAGGLAGCAGAALAQVLAALALRHGGAEWLHGPFGPPFFGLALSTGILYGAIGAANGRRGAAAGFLGGFLGLALPLYVMTRYGGWSGRQWSYATLAVYTAAIWGTIAAIGAVASGTKPWRGAAAAMLGSLAGYAALAVCLGVCRGLAAAPRRLDDPRPAFINVLDGILSGAGLCLALSLDRRLSRRTS